MSLALAGALFSASAMMAQDAVAPPQVIIKDCAGDVGLEPNTSCWAFYASPDIWVRNLNDNGLVHQSPVTGQTNYIHVLLTNIGSGTLGSGTVHVYFAKASTGLDWSSDWISNIIGGIVYGDHIGSQTINNLPAGGSVTAIIPWTTVPNPANFNDPDARHFCLLARFESNEDPMTYPEVTSINDNTRNNNNIAWKNVSIMDASSTRGAVDVKKSEDADGPTELRFAVPEGEENVLDHCKIKVDLGAELTEIWQAGGGQGEGVTMVDNPDGGQTLEINDPQACIWGLELAAGRRYTMHVEVVYGEFNPDLAGRTFHWNVEQYQEGNDQAVGGEAYDITMPSTDRPDVMIKDCLSDVGGEPNSNCGAFYMSPDIWVRNNQDNGLTHQSPIPGPPSNYIYVRAKNIGTSTLNSGTVHVYFAKASTGLDWSSDWVNNLPYGDEIGTATISNLAPGAETIVEIEWPNVPDPANFNDPDARHFCLLARFESNEDPMTYPEGTAISPNVQNNNNIAWKNVSIMNAGTPRGAVDVKKDAHWDGLTELRFAVPDDEKGDNFLNHGRIKVELDDELQAIWKAAGQPGEGFTVAEDGALWITEPFAKIGGYNLGTDTRYTMHVEMVYGEFDPELAGKTYHWMITQHNEGDETPYGGEGYDIVMPNSPDEIHPKRTVTPEMSELSSMMKLTARPNPTASATTIAYTLPAASRVSIAIYDANGSQVRELLVNADRTAGAHETNWNGLTADGKRLPSGTYLCRLSTAFGSTEQQIKITR